MSSKDPFRFLRQLLSQPTAPFFEDCVRNTLIKELTQQKIPYFLDPHGNLIAGVDSALAYKKWLHQKNHRFLFVAHMDHPGFHGTQWIDDQKLKIAWLGGSPSESLEKAWFSLNLKNHVEPLGRGQLIDLKFTQTARGPHLSQATLCLEKKLKFYPKAQDLFGAFEFSKPVWIENDLLYTKAADDLVGCYLIFSLLKKYKNKLGRLGRWVGIFTRAEEVGFIGLIRHFISVEKLQGKLLKPWVVSLETSRELPQAEIGKGPVIRLGDRSSIFDASGTQLWIQAALKKKKTLTFQRRIMDGGTCEGTAANAFNYKTLAMSLPLGNYHNEDPSTHVPAPEYISLKDLKQALCLIETLIAIPDRNWREPWFESKKKLHTQTLKYNKFFT